MLWGSSQKPIHRIKQFDFDYPNERLACEHPQRQIYLSQFEIGIYLVTNHQFGFSVDNAGYQAGRELDGLGKSVWYKQPGQPFQEKWYHPAGCVIYKDALAYCQWLSPETGDKIKLSSEAQWEKAACGDDVRL